MRILALCLVALLFVTSCATAPKVRNIQTSWEIDASYDDVWTALIETFADFNLSIETIEKDSGLVGGGWQTIPKNYCDCGSPGLMTDWERSGKFNVFVKKTDTGTSLKVNAVFRVRRTFGDSSSMVNCVSTGVLENAIYQHVEDRL